MLVDSCRHLALNDTSADEGGNSDSVHGFPGTVMISDTQFFNELLLPATLGSSVKFEVDYTTQAEGGHRT